ncbi:hypothetical protein Pyrde_0084 [Pyrodictium delaneyi]|uniref:Zona occludens toxin N-terminal domain-containing protein n=1 Tax=Pyrodictium delaneyi TaxID=1273541 RepID=A0A0P0N004_9CREN|nr:hypothetical protein [Pyrodictium delaneyi]ALL00134.1 hypothetical protein Pyrde_0084 [Pyrodictium delaneyi]OWJ54224.1 hypothetical protein Pdsh_06960 [Pyrodictium delaneyi]
MSLAKAKKQLTLQEFINRHTAKMPHLEVIWESYVNDYGLLWGIFAYPNAIFKRGIGKSVLAIKLLLGVYRDWDTAKKYIFYSPTEFVRVFKELVDHHKRIPLAIWDDAGAWLFRGRYKSKFVMAVVEHLEVIRTHVSTMIFTATSYGKLAKGIRESLSLVDLVSVENVKPRRDIPECRRLIEANRGKTYRELAEAHEKCFVKISKTRGYIVDSEDFEWLFYRRKMPEPLWEYRFMAVLPDEIYLDYKRMRDKYVEAGTKKIQKELEELAEKAAEELEEIAESDDKEAVEELELEDIAREWGYI